MGKQPDEELPLAARMSKGKRAGHCEKTKAQAIASMDEQV